MDNDHVRQEAKILGHAIQSQEHLSLLMKVLKQRKGECTFEPTDKDTNHLGDGIVGSNKLQDRRGHGAIDKKTTSKTKGKFLL